MFWLDSLYRDDELYAMMLAQAYYGRDSQGNAVYGTKNAALTLFHVPVTEMACQQQVQLIYMFKAPSLYRPVQPAGRKQQALHDALPEQIQQ